MDKQLLRIEQTLGRRGRHLDAGVSVCVCVGGGGAIERRKGPYEGGVGRGRTINW